MLGLRAGTFWRPAPRAAKRWPLHCARAERAQKSQAHADAKLRTPLTQDEIDARIQMAQARKKAVIGLRLSCPGCKQDNFSPKGLFSHMQKCCADLFDGDYQVRFLSKDYGPARRQASTAD